MPGLEGTRFGPYTLKRLLGLGGMAEVYLADDRQHGSEVAIKTINGNQPEYLERFRREAEAIDKLRHPHVLPAYDYGDQGPWHYLVMPYITGGTLRDRLEAGPLAADEAGVILKQVAEALQHAHDNGILHRDIKPSNILFGENQHAYLADFGLAKILEDGQEITRTGTLMGTPEYMAPDLANGPATSLADVYALGIVLYQMLTGKPPFEGNNAVEIYWKHLRELPLPPSQLNPALTPAIDHVVLSALAKDPRRRYQSALALDDAYQRALHMDVEVEKIITEVVAERKGQYEEAVSLVAKADEGYLVNTPAQGDHPGRRRGHRRFVRVADYALAQANLLRKIGTSGRALQLIRAREARLRERLTPTPTQKEAVAQTPGRPPRSRLMLPPLPLRKRSRRELVANASTSNPGTQSRPPRLPAQRRKNIMISVIGAGIFCFIVLPMGIIYYLYAAHHANKGTAATPVVQETVGAPGIDTTNMGLLLADPLNKNTLKRWPEDAQHCFFAGGAYHVRTDQSNGMHHCMLNEPALADVGNVMIQVNVSLQSGSSAGLLLRTHDEQFYDFEITSLGQFFLRRYDAGTNYVSLIGPTASSAIAPGANTNTLLVMAQGDRFKLYINNIFVGEAHDKTYQSGQIALVADSLSATTRADCTFRGLKISKA